MVRVIQTHRGRSDGKWQDHSLGQAHRVWNGATKGSVHQGVFLISAKSRIVVTETHTISVKGEASLVVFFPAHNIKDGYKKEMGMITQ